MFLREEFDALLGGPSYEQVVIALLAHGVKQVLEKFGVSSTNAAVIQAAREFS